MDRREYVCNQMYKQHDLLRKGSWTDADKLEYMELNIAPYSRYWRMGMKKALKHAIRLLREEEEKADRKTEPTGYNLSPVDKDINVRSKDEPQTERIKTHDYCDICNHKRCGDCIANNLDDYCVPSGYEPITKTETQNSNLIFEKDECAKEYEELGLKELKELIEADRKTDQTERE